MSEHPYGAAENTVALEPQPITIGRYLLHRQIARGGMATIHIARLMGDVGFSRIVAAKRLLPEFAEDAEFVAMFLDEARIASKVHHRNVVPVLDVVTTGDEAILVQEYVHGAPLHWLLRAARNNKTRVRPDIAVSIACQVLAGLHAAHETLDEMGMPLNIVHRDVSPQNVMIATDGTARLLDFGVAKATLAAHVTREGQFKGKLAYSSPEQLRGQATRQSDLYSLAAMLWEVVVGHRMHQSLQAEAELITTIMTGGLPTITEALAAERGSFEPEHWRQIEALEPIIRSGLAIELSERWATAAEMEQALIDAIRPASLTEVAAWLRSLGREFIDKHDRALAAEEASWRRLGTTMQRRLAPITSEVRKGAQLPVTSDPSAPVSQPRPTAPGRWVGSNALIALLCGLIVALAVGIVFAVRGSPTPPAVANPSPEQAPADRPAAAATATRPVEPPAASPTAPAAAAPAAGSAKTVEPEPQPDAIELQVEGPPAPAAPAHSAGTPPVRQVRPQASRQATPKKSAAAAAPPPATSTPSSPPASSPPAGEPGADCNPPYYYEGQKKIFKPNCI